MKLNLTVSEINALSSAGISFREGGEYSEDEALELLEQVREAEVSVAQFTSGDQKKAVRHIRRYRRQTIRSDS